MKAVVPQGERTHRIFLSRSPGVDGKHTPKHIQSLSLLSFGEEELR